MSTLTKVHNCSLEKNMWTFSPANREICVLMGVLVHYIKCLSKGQ